MNPRRAHVLFADRDLAWSLPLRKLLRERGLAVDAVSTAGDLLDRAAAAPPDLLVLGEALDAPPDGLLAGRVRERSPGVRIIRVVSPDRPTTEEPGSDFLCLTTRRTSLNALAALVEGTLGLSSRDQPPLVVCVDDEPLFLRGLARALRQQGFGVLTYTEAERALEELALMRPDLVILDVRMPGMGGFEALDEIRRRHPAVPVVLLSALGGEERIAEGRRRGAARYLTKPCSPEVLQEVLGRLLDASRSRKGGGA